MLVALLLQAALADGAAFEREAWGRFGRRGALSRRSEQVTVATDGRDGGRQGALHYKLRLATSGPQAAEDVLWASSRTCPAVREVVASLRTLTPPSPQPPGFDDGDLVILADGTGYELTVPVADRAGQSRITWRSNVGTPLATWVDRSLAALAPCWSPVELRGPR